MVSKIPTTWEKGQGLVEYALILVLVAIVVIVILATMGPAIAGVYCGIVVTLGSPCEGGAGHYYDQISEMITDCDADAGIIVDTPAAYPEGYLP